MAHLRSLSREIEVRRVITEACSSSLTMRKACSKTSFHYSTFKRFAIKFNCWKPNKGARGTNKGAGYAHGIMLDILSGKHPDYQTFKLKNLLFRFYIKSNKCEICGTSEWNGAKIQCELDHIDGNSKNHKLENLRILCPNCHSQTNTFRFKKRPSGGMAYTSLLKSEA